MEQNDTEQNVFRGPALCDIHMHIHESRLYFLKANDEHYSFVVYSHF